MRNIFLLVTILLFIGGGLPSCLPRSSKTYEANNLQFDTIRAVTNYYINNDSTQPSCNLKLSFVYPSSYSDKSVLDSLQHIFVSCYFDKTYSKLSLSEAVDSYKENYVESYKEDFRIFSQDTEENRDGGSDMFVSYYETISSRILFNKGGILSWQMTQTNYKGGSSSFDLLKNFVVDLSTLLLINENDLFNEGYEKALNVVFKDHLLSSKKVRTIADLENLGYFGLDEMIPNGNFILDDKGITYIFNKGEYSSMKTDPIKIFIPYDELAPLIREGSPIEKFISL